MLIHSKDHNEVIDYLDIISDKVFIRTGWNRDYEPKKIVLLVPCVGDKIHLESRYNCKAINLMIFASTVPEEFERICGHRASTIIILHPEQIPTEILESVWMGWSVINSSEDPLIAAKLRELP